MARPSPAQAALLAAQAMGDNPTHVAVFGDEAGHRQQRLQLFFAGVLPWIADQGILLGAFDDVRPVGVLGLLPPGCCQPGGRPLLRLGLRLLRGQNPAQAVRMLRWLHAWRRSDPRTVHWHLGPLAVAPAHRRRGIGTALLEQGLARIDDAPALAYLETDLPRNVALYERLGFVVSARKDVLGVPNWFMQRGPVQHG